MDVINRENKILGIIWTIAHCFMVACISASTKSLIKYYNTFQIIFLQNFISLILLSVWLLFKKRFYIKINNLPINLIRVFSNFAGLTLYYYSLKFVPLIEVRAITLTSPIIKTILAIIILKETAYTSQIIGLAIGLIGSLIIVIEPSTLLINNSIFLVIGSVAAWSFSSIFIKILIKQEDNQSQLFFFLSFTTVLSLIIAIKYWNFIIPEHTLLIVITGIFYFINVVFTLEAYKYAPITVLMPFNFSTLVFTTLIAFFLFNETPTIKTFIGASIIFIASLYVTYNQVIRQSK